jgi:hypothetical protein
MLDIEVGGMEPVDATQFCEQDKDDMRSCIIKKYIFCDEPFYFYENDTIKATV